MTKARIVFAAALLAAFVVAVRVAAVGDRLLFTAPALAAQADPASAQETPAGKDASGKGHEASSKEHEASSGWGATIAKTFNFAILVGVLVYFLRTPLATYLVGRISKVREDLVAAQQTRETAARQLAEIDAKLKGLPLEIEALRQRGAEDIAAERTLIEQAATADRERLLEQMRREIDMKLRIARRELLEITAGRAIGIARERIAHAITPDDQARLVDRYATQLKAQADADAAVREAGS